jgi:hypothetical protein
MARGTQIETSIAFHGAPSRRLTFDGWDRHRCTFVDVSRTSRWCCAISSPVVIRKTLISGHSLAGTLRLDKSARFGAHPIAYVRVDIGALVPSYPAAAGSLAQPTQCAPYKTAARKSWETSGDLVRCSWDPLRLRHSVGVELPIVRHTPYKTRSCGSTRIRIRPGSIRQ